ncbi:hypothetical protein HOD08_02445 [bacterium]|nr:hypothetical protein [bacterium]
MSKKNTASILLLLLSVGAQGFGPDNNRWSPRSWMDWSVIPRDGWFSLSRTPISKDKDALRKLNMAHIGTKKRIALDSTAVIGTIAISLWIMIVKERTAHRTTKWIMPEEPAEDDWLAQLAKMTGAEEDELESEHKGLVEQTVEGMTVKQALKTLFKGKRALKTSWTLAWRAAIALALSEWGQACWMRQHKMTGEAIKGAQVLAKGHADAARQLSKLLPAFEKKRGEVEKLEKAVEEKVESIRCAVAMAGFVETEKITEDIIDKCKEVSSLEETIAVRPENKVAMKKLLQAKRELVALSAGEDHFKWSDAATELVDQRAAIGDLAEKCVYAGEWHDAVQALHANDWHRVRGVDCTNEELCDGLVWCAEKPQSVLSVLEERYKKS